MRKTALALLLLLPAALAVAGEDEVFEKAFSLEGVSRISVQNVNGRIEASAWDRPYLRVRATKTGPGRSDETLRQTEIRVRKIGDQIRVETVNGSVEVAFDRNSSVRYQLETVNGRIEGDIDLVVEGKHGPKEARGSYNG